MKVALGKFWILLAFTILLARLATAQSDDTTDIQATLARSDWRAVIDLVLQRADQLSQPISDWLLGYASLTSDNYRQATEHFARLDNNAKLEDLLRFASEFSARQPESSLAQMMKGDALARLAQYHESLSALDLAVKLDSHSPLLLNTRGAIRVLSGDKAGGQDDFLKALDLAPNAANTYANLGLVQMASGHFLAAANDFSRAIQLAPDYGLSYNNRAAAYAGLHQWDSAAVGFAQAASLTPALNYASGNGILLGSYRTNPAFRTDTLSSAIPSVPNSQPLAYEHQREEIEGHLAIDVFIVRVTPETTTFDGMTTVVQDIVRRLQEENHLSANRPLRLQIDGSAFNSAPEDRMRFAALMGERAQRDAVVLLDFSGWFASPQTIMWSDQVAKASDQLARAAAAIHLVTGQEPTLNAYSGVAEAFVKIGERLERGGLAGPVRENLAFDSVVLSAYPFREGGIIGDVPIQSTLLQHVSGNIINFYSDAFANNQLEPNARVANVLATDSRGAAIQHMNFNDVTLTDGSENPLLMMGSRVLREGGSVSLGVGKLTSAPAPLPVLRDAADNLDRLSAAVSFLHELTQIDIPMKIKAPLALGGSVLRDVEAARDHPFNPLTSETLEAMGRFGLDELPTIIDKLIESGRLPATYKNLLKTPVFAGLPDFVAAASQQVGRNSVAPSYEEVSLYAEGLFKVTGAVIGAYSRYPNGAAIGSSAAGLLSDTVKGASQAVGHEMVLSEAGPRLIAEWNAQIDSSLVRHLPAKTFSEMYGVENLIALGYDPKSITERDNFVRWLNTVGIAKTGGSSPTVEHLLQTPIPSAASGLSFDEIERTLSQRDHNLPTNPPTSSLRCPPYCGPPVASPKCINCGPPPPPPTGTKCINCEPPPPPPPPVAKCVNCNAPPLPPPLVSEATLRPPISATPQPSMPPDRGGVLMTAVVVKDAPADLGGFFSGAHSQSDSPRPFFTPFLQFCAMGGAK